MYIDVRIPWDDKRRLGFAINRAMETVEDWVLILDSDVLPITPVWYHIALDTIARVGHEAGWITCYTNKIGSPLQKAPGCPKGENMDEHFQYAKQLYLERKDSIIEPSHPKFKYSGFFMLTHKEAFNKVTSQFDLPENKFLGYDNWYFDRLKNCGYKTYLMESVYFYHSYRRLWKGGGFWRGIFNNHEKRTSERKISKNE